MAKRKVEAVISARNEASDDLNVVKHDLRALTVESDRFLASQRRASAGAGKGMAAVGKAAKSATKDAAGMKDVVEQTGLSMGKLGVAAAVVAMVMRSKLGGAIQWVLDTGAKGFDILYENSIEPLVKGLVELVIPGAAEAEAGLKKIEARTRAIKKSAAEAAAEYAGWDVGKLPKLIKLHEKLSSELVVGEGNWLLLNERIKQCAARIEELKLEKNARLMERLNAAMAPPKSRFDSPVAQTAAAMTGAREAEAADKARVADAAREKSIDAIIEKSRTLEGIEKKIAETEALRTENVRKIALARRTLEGRTDVARGRRGADAESILDETEGARRRLEYLVHSRQRSLDKTVEIEKAALDRRKEQLETEADIADEMKRQADEIARQLAHQKEQVGLMSRHDQARVKSLMGASKDMSIENFRNLPDEARELIGRVDALRQAYGGLLRQAGELAGVGAPAPPEASAPPRPGTSAAGVAPAPANAVPVRVSFDPVAVENRIIVDDSASIAEKFGIAALAALKKFEDRIGAVLLEKILAALESREALDALERSLAG